MCFLITSSAEWTASNYFGEKKHWDNKLLHKLVGLFYAFEVIVIQWRFIGLWTSRSSSAGVNQWVVTCIISWGKAHHCISAAAGEGHSHSLLSLTNLCCTGVAALAEAQLALSHCHLSQWWNLQKCWEVKGKDLGNQSWSWGGSRTTGAEGKR